MILRRTHAYLSSYPKTWDDNGYLVFGTGVIDPDTRGMEAVLTYFGDRHIVRSISGHADSELFVTDQALRQVDLRSAQRALVALLEDEVRMFSASPVERETLKISPLCFLPKWERARSTQMYMSTRWANKIAASVHGHQ